MHRVITVKIRDKPQLDSHLFLTISSSMNRIKTVLVKSNVLHKSILLYVTINFWFSTHLEAVVRRCSS